MSIIVFDCETTGLLSAHAAGQQFQPYLIDLYAIKLGNDLAELDKIHIRCKPPIEIPEQATKVHGITDRNVVDCYPFVYYFQYLADYFLGSHLLVGHNLLYDKMVLYWELVRLGKVMNFPWSPGACCTAEVSSQYNGFRMNLADLHIHLFGEGFTGAHSASVDCEITCRCFKELVRKEMVII